ncbi:MAG TPA: hypothetical protein P5079_01100 [Elusimicrobiota bacterium]|nr:hypothetical protein [Elusimicrobiota bacterium]
MKEWLQKRWVQNTLLVAGTAAVAYLMVFIDVQARAREAYRQGETSLRWAQNPDEKKQFYEEKFLREKKKLDRRREKAEISQEDYDQDLEVLKFDRDQVVGESSLKYAYQWFKDTYELFSPPESKWVRRARLMAPAAKERWREELRAKNIPFEEYMLDLEIGEEPGTLMVYSTRGRKESERAAELLRSKGIEPKVYDAPAHGRLPQEGLKILVPRDKFWEAHEILKAAGFGR